MNSLNSKLKSFKDAIKSIDHDQIYHYEAADRSDRYIVWAETGPGDDLRTNNSIDEQVIAGIIDLYTHVEFDDLVDQIQKALDDHNISFALSDIQYENESKYIHYSWDWQM